MNLLGRRKGGISLQDYKGRDSLPKVGGTETREAERRVEKDIHATLSLTGRGMFPSCGLQLSPKAGAAWLLGDGGEVDRLRGCNYGTVMFVHQIPFR